MRSGDFKETYPDEGDVDFDSVRSVASAVTPVPGGVGPMTVAFLLSNLADAVEAQEAAR